MSNDHITRGYRKFELVWRQSLESVVAVQRSENEVLAEAGPLGSRLSITAERERSTAIVRRVGGQYVAALFNLQLTSHT